MNYQVSRPNDDTDRTLWMGDLSTDWDQTFISDAFARMGEEVTNVKIVFDKHSGKVCDLLQFTYGVKRIVVFCFFCFP